MITAAAAAAGCRLQVTTSCYPVVAEIPHINVFTYTYAFVQFIHIWYLQCVQQKNIEYLFKLFGILQGIQLFK